MLAAESNAIKTRVLLLGPLLTAQPQTSLRSAQIGDEMAREFQYCRGRRIFSAVSPVSPRQRTISRPPSCNRKAVIRLKHPLRAGLLPALVGLLPDAERRAARQTFGMGVITAAQLLSGLAQVYLSARILGPAGYGVLSIIIAVTWFGYRLLAIPSAEVIASFATRSLVTGRPDEAGRVLYGALLVNLATAGLAYAVIVALFYAAGDWLGIDRTYLGAAALYALTGIFLAAHQGSLAALRLADRLLLGLAVTVASGLALVAMLTAVWLTGGGLLAVTLTYVASAALTGIGMLAALAVAARRAGIPLSLRAAAFRIPIDALRFQAGSYGKNIAWTLARDLDIILLAQFTGPANVGLYRGAQQIARAARVPFFKLSEVMQVEYGRRWHLRPGRELRRLIFRFSLASFLLALAGFGLLAALHQPVIRVILGPAFAGAAPLLLIMLPGVFLSSGLLALAVLPAAAGRIRPSLTATLAGLAVAIAVILVLAPGHWVNQARGATGAAWASTAYFIAFTAVMAPSVIAMLRQISAPPPPDDTPANP